MILFVVFIFFVNVLILSFVLCVLLFNEKVMKFIKWLVLFENIIMCLINGYRKVINFILKCIVRMVLFVVVIFVVVGWLVKIVFMGFVLVED